MERKDLLEKNAGIFREQGVSIKNNAKPTCKILVVGNPANTNAWLLRHYGNLPSKNVTAMTRLDMNRARNMVGRRVGVPGHNVKNVVIWGNHSSTQYPDVNNATVISKNGTQPVRSAISDDEWLNTAFIADVQQRGAKVIQTRGASSATSAARAIVDHMRDWHLGTPEGESISMGVWSEGNSYGIANDLIYSFPVSVKNGEWNFVNGLKVDDFSRELLKKTEAELTEEKVIAIEITKPAQ
jgi:malate dehydrogenase